MLKPYSYGYLNRIRSSRLLEAETHCNLAVMWLRRCLRPEFRTIRNFRQDNRKAFRPMFPDSVKVCRNPELFGRELVSVDSMRIKAVNSRDRNLTAGKLLRELEACQERLDRFLQRMDDMDKVAAGPAASPDGELAKKIAALQDRRTHLEAQRKALQQSGREQLSLTDPDARAMYADSGVGVGYNVQTAGGTKHKLIAEQQVQSQVPDMGLLAEAAGAARTDLHAERIDVVVDKGYFKVEDIADCQAVGVTRHVPKPQRSPDRRTGRLGNERFRYDAASDTFVCPGGQRLRPMYRSRVRDETLLRYANRGACRDCALRALCITGNYRCISRYGEEAVLDLIAKRLASQPGLLDRRRESAEHPFGSIKHWMGRGGFLIRRLRSVRGKFRLTALAYNIRRATTLVGNLALIAALRT